MKKQHFTLTSGRHHRHPGGDTHACVIKRKRAQQGGKASGLHYDGHVSMLDVEGEFFCQDDKRGDAIFKRYFNTRTLF